MLPMFWFWSPNVRLPWSGDVSQDLAATFDAFFQGMPGAAGDGQMERQMHQRYSYGRQLGWLTELILDMAAHDATLDRRERAPLTRLTEANKFAKRIKGQIRHDRWAQLQGELRALKEHEPELFEKVIHGLDLQRVKDAD